MPTFLNPYQIITPIFLSASLLILVLLLLSHRVDSDPTQDKQALLTFLSQTPHENRLQWNESDSACNWVGVKCDANQSYVHSLRLPGVGLVGPIPSNSLSRLTQLRVISLRSNQLTGPLPNFSNLKFLRSLYLHNNKLSGEFPTSLAELTRLTRLDLSNNNLTGSIPSLFAKNNLTLFNVSNNNLRGSIPQPLDKFPAPYFAGNADLCGPPLSPCNQRPLHNQPKKLSTPAVIAICIGAVLIVLIMLVVLILWFRRRREKIDTATPKNPVAVADAGSSVEVTDEERERNKLVFWGGGGGFDLEDLLRASAEVLGKGSVGTTYKAVLEEGMAVVVKRLKDGVVGRKEFEEQMEVLGCSQQENVATLRAFLYSRDEKLLVYDYMSGGSLSALLHGSRGSGRTPLDWDNRMRIALTTARGLAYLHTSGKVVHGNIKSSNILLGSNNHNACISDIGINPLFSGSTSTSPNHCIGGGYHAPEVVETHKQTFKSDVYSFGVLLLELLTGKSPNQASLGDEGIDLPRWVQSVVQEEWTAEVFDSELMRYSNSEEEMVRLLQIAMACVATVPDQRPEMPQVASMIEEMNRVETDDWSDDRSKGSHGHTPPPESRTPPPGITP